MKIHRLQITQRVPGRIDEAWQFVTNPKNLRQITPPWLDLKLSGEVPQELYAGQLITYDLRPLFGLPMSWVTEIKQVYRGDRFIEEQKFGPFKLWHQEHYFRKIEGGVEIEDRIQYVVPGGILSGLINETLVRKRLNEIFQFRGQSIEERLGRWQAPGSAQPQQQRPQQGQQAPQQGQPAPPQRQQAPAEAQPQRPNPQQGPQQTPKQPRDPNKPVTLEDIFGPDDGF